MPAHEDRVAYLGPRESDRMGLNSFCEYGYALGFLVV